MLFLETQVGAVRHVPGAKMAEFEEKLHVVAPDMM
jgi:hypothetical protein